MNYEIIKDEKLLRDFIDWLPALKQTEKYYLCLFARSKYSKEEKWNRQIVHIKSDKAQLKRFVSDKERMFDKIRQLEVPLGAYKQREIEIPQECLALYITPNPRDLWKATYNSLVKLAECVRDNNTFNNPHQEVLSEIQRTKGTRYYVDFDIDLKGEALEDAIYLIKKVINPEAVTWLKTRGGVHCLVSPNMVSEPYEKTWYKNIKTVSDQCGDTMLPVPGTFQGGFVPHFVNL